MQTQVQTSKLLLWTDLLMYYGVLVACATIPFSIALATGGLFGAAFGWIFRCLLRRQIGWRASALDKFILLFLAVQVLSVVFSTDRLRSANELRSYWHILPFLVLMQGEFSEKRLVRATMVLIIAGIASAATGIGQYLTHALDAAAIGPKRVTGTFGMYMTYAGILAMIWAVTLNQAIRQGISRRLRFLFIAALCVISCALILTLTRNALLGVAAAAILLLALKLPKGFLAVVAVAIIVMIAVPSARQLALRTIWGNQTPQLDTNRMLPWADQRPYLWKGAYRIMRDHPLAGVGLSNFRFAYKKYLPYELPKTYNHAHNNFLHLGAETGLPGLFTFALLVLATFAFLFKAYWTTTSGTSRALLGGVFCAFFGFQVSGLLEYNFGDAEVAVLYWLLLGIAAVAANIPVRK